MSIRLIERITLNPPFFLLRIKNAQNGGKDCLTQLLQIQTKKDVRIHSQEEDFSPMNDSAEQLFTFDETEIKFTKKRGNRV